ncbi:MAG TPA: CGNR zinc finger domain-containing protein [Candidatus Limnocylindria bacterium]|nr:CGNR zinc finger domain-containing protein [Candidatus Limnocylindria bacterium]
MEPVETEELFVAFANTLSYTRGAAHDDIPDADALLGWLRAHDLVSSRGRATEAARLRRDPDEAERRLERFRHLRGLLHDTAWSISRDGLARPEQLTELNHVLRHGLHYHQLRIGPDGNRYEVSQVGDRLDQARAAIASSFAHFVADDAPDRLRVCANDGCRDVFVDRSPGGKRRWCDMRTCGNQAKVARHRARARELAAGVPSPVIAD